MTAPDQNVIVLPEEDREHVSRAILLALTALGVVASHCAGEPELVWDLLEQGRQVCKSLYPQSGQQGIDDLHKLAAKFGIPMKVHHISLGGSKHVN